MGHGSQVDDRQALWHGPTSRTLPLYRRVPNKSEFSRIHSNILPSIAAAAAAIDVLSRSVVAAVGGRSVIVQVTPALQFVPQQPVANLTQSIPHRKDVDRFDGKLNGTKWTKEGHRGGAIELGRLTRIEVPHDPGLCDANSRITDDFLGFAPVRSGKSAVCRSQGTRVTDETQRQAETPTLGRGAREPFVRLTLENAIQQTVKQPRAHPGTDKQKKAEYNRCLVRNGKRGCRNSLSRIVR